MSYVVIDHYLNKNEGEGGVYHLVVGTVSTQMRPETDAEGNLILTEKKVLDEFNEPMKDTKGNEIIVPGPPRLVESTERQVLQDYAFAADDPRWAGKPLDQVADLQRQAVKDQIKKHSDERDKATARAAEARKELPKVGEAL